jgi:hypothetical protein
MGHHSPAMVRNREGAERRPGTPAVTNEGVFADRVSRVPHRQVLSAWVHGRARPPAMERLDVSVAACSRSPEAPA